MENDKINAECVGISAESQSSKKADEFVNDEEEEVDDDDQFFNLTSKDGVEKVMQAKASNPGMFVSAWEEDETNINKWSKSEIAKSPEKQFIIAAENGKLDEMRLIILQEKAKLKHPLISETIENQSDSNHQNGDVTNVETQQNKLEEQSQHQQIDRLIPNEEEAEAMVRRLVNWKDDDGYSPLHRAVYNGHCPVVRELIRLGADLSSITNDGWQPIHSAAFWSQSAAIRLLLARPQHVDINAVTNGGQTPLHVCLGNNPNREAICSLLSHVDVRVDIENNCGDTAQQFADRYTPFAHVFRAFSVSASELFEVQPR